jgi:uncharacterized caspase-like protein
MRTPFRLRNPILPVVLIVLGFCAVPLSSSSDVQPAVSLPDPASQLLPVDCLLPGRIRKLGRQVTYLTPRQALKTTALDCEIRGGEYVSYDRANYDTALRVWKPQAEGGDAKAQNYVGEIYERGLGIPPDHAEAARWYRLAAEQGYAPAQLNLGQLLEQGLGVPRDVPAALEWYRRASGLETVSLPYVAEVEAPAKTAPPAPPPVVPSPPVPDESAKELERLQAELARSREELAQARQEAAEASRAHANAPDPKALEASSAELARRSDEVNARETALAAKERELEQGRQEVERLKQEAAADKQSAAALKQEAAAKPAPPPPEATPVVTVAQTPAPTIHLIDPQVPPSRGAETVRTGSSAGERVIVGRVEAPGGLVLLSVNDAEIQAAENGIFQSRVRLLPSETPVTIVAVDRLGRREVRAITLIPDKPATEAATATASTAPARPPVPAIEFGPYHALVIGNDQYEHMPRLTTAVADATAVADILKRKYHFQVTTLYNANRYQILSALNELRAELTERDNLLIYYAGHGELDEANMRGNWLPVDAEQNSTANWISNTSLTDLLNAMAARHILVVADSCYSGSLTRSSLARLERGMTEEARIAWQTKMAEGRSRTALTSGGLQPVLDGGGGKHSVFAKAFLNVLEANGDVLEGQRLYSEISALVTWAAEAQRFTQLPEYAPIKFGGHESGDFFFVPGA